MRLLEAAVAAALLPLITELMIELVNEFISILPPTGMVKTGVAFSLVAVVVVVVVVD